MTASAFARSSRSRSRSTVLIFSCVFFCTPISPPSNIFKLHLIQTLHLLKLQSSPKNGNYNHKPLTTKPRVPKTQQNNLSLHPSNPTTHKLHRPNHNPHLPMDGHIPQIALPKHSLQPLPNPLPTLPNHLNPLPPRIFQHRISIHSPHPFSTNSLSHRLRPRT